jgi:hypothetical protein
MNGYLMQEQQWIPGEDLFVESFSPENSYGVVFEDDGQTAYFYAVEKDKEGAGLRVLDALHIQETGDEPEEDEDPGDDPGDEPGEDPADEDVADGDVADGDDDEGNVADDDADDADSEEEPEINGNVADGQPPGGVKPNRLQIVWSNDWMKCALVIDGFCHALFDFEAHGGYNINEFPPPNEFWTQGDRKLSDDMMRQLF